ncbi:sce7726 family protein [Sphingopyxis indica]|uniref:sce7726 family protein n=1 Tax=Sphingopyxis indica TaxID=436663 RepID=UPI002B2E0FFF|nr:sce7726 family protein [Sphingopyxis indica]
METALLRDGDIRRAAYRKLLRHAEACDDTLIIDELGLGHGACRVDIAVINGHIRGLEIKAEADTLVRLPRQIEAYGSVVDKATLIVAERHLRAAKEILPDWWGVVVAARSKSGVVTFQRVRGEHINRGTDPMMIARLLWRDEVVAMLRSRGESERALRAPRTELYRLLTRSVSVRTLSRLVRDTLKAREGWRDRTRLSRYDGSYPPSAMS